MTEEHSANRPGRHVGEFNSRPGVPPATVASLGIRVHLVAADPDRERQRSDLISACERLRADWERLFRQIINHLGDDDQGSCRDSHPTPGSDL